MPHGRRVSGQDTCTDRDGPCGRDAVANIGNQLAETETGRNSGSTGRKNVEELEESSLRKDGRQRAVHTNQQTISFNFHTQHGMQAEQNDHFGSLEP